MISSPTFGELLEAVDHLPPEVQEDLVMVIKRRLAERGRQRVVEDVRQARQEFAEGKCKPMSVAEITSEIQS
jgi:hypothetical protein